MPGGGTVVAAKDITTVEAVLTLLTVVVITASHLTQYNRGSRDKGVWHVRRGEVGL